VTEVEVDASKSMLIAILLPLALKILARKLTTWGSDCPDLPFILQPGQ